MHEVVSAEHLPPPCHQLRPGLGAPRLPAPEHVKGQIGEMRLGERHGTHDCATSMLLLRSGKGHDRSALKMRLTRLDCTTNSPTSAMGDDQGHNSSIDPNSAAATALRACACRGSTHVMRTPQHATTSNGFPQQPGLPDRDVYSSRTPPSHTGDPRGIRKSVHVGGKHVLAPQRAARDRAFHLRPRLPGLMLGLKKTSNR